MKAVILFFALTSTIAALGFFQLGQNCGWTSDGPGVLIFMAGLLFAGIISLISWYTLITSS